MKTKKPLTNDNLQAKISSLEDQLKRSLADYINLQNRVEREKEVFATLTTISVLSRLIDVVDDLNLVSAHLQDQGLSLAVKKFDSVLSQFGLTKIEAEGKEFNPEIMDCLETAEGKENIVLKVRKNGYLINGQCLRPASVVVGKKSEVIN
jgi:molecular chaperone GrpE